MKKGLIIIIVLLSMNSFSQQFNVLLFTKAKEYKHGVTQTAVDAIWDLSRMHYFGLQVTDDARVFEAGGLDNIQVIVFLNNSGNILNENQQKGFKQFIENGGGFVGIHGATTAEKEWEWYGRFIGRYFTAHPKIQTAEINVADKNFPATYHLPQTWVWSDEWYEFTPALSEDLNVILTVDETTYNPVFESQGKSFTGMGQNHPIAWYQEMGKGRMFYTALGHLEKAWSDPMFLQHIYGGIFWASKASR